MNFFSLPPSLPPSSLLKNADYRTNNPYLGCSVGRVANRIRDAKFTIEDQTYTVSANVAPHTLHGGAVGFNKVINLFVVNFAAHLSNPDF
jgi:galactose mutarotase-like enzyme